jgi:hypothetical protein
MATRTLPRRTFLRGIGGTMIALPALEIMLNRHGDAYAAGDRIPRRLLVAFNGQSLGHDGDPVHNLYAPDMVGPNYDLKTATMPLGNYGNIKDHVTIVSGLRIPRDEGFGTPAAGWSLGFHPFALGPLITGMRVKPGDALPSANGPTADQVVADALVGQTLIHSLQYQVQASWYLEGSSPVSRDLISFKLDGMGNVVPNPGQVSPKLAFDSLFQGFVPPDPAEAAAKAYELAKRKSILDLVRGDYELLIPKLGKADNQRVQRHLDELRDLELELEGIPPMQTEQCKLLPDPGPDPDIGGPNVNLGGDGFDVNTGYSDEAKRARIFHDLIRMAYVCDMTRSITLLYTMAQSHMNIHPIAGFPYDQHELGHAGGYGTEQMSQVIAWHVDLYAQLVASLRDTPEGAGTVLDNCALVLLHEGGHGLGEGNVDNLSHSTENMACMIAGGAGGLRRGEHVVAAGLHPANVLITAMHAVGVEQDLGEVSGTVPGLLG